MGGTTPSAMYPLELHIVKTLFLQHQYKECIQACREILHAIDDIRFPLHRPYILFFLGSAHDELARLIHKQSPAKIPAFDQAAQYFTAALDSLPTARTSYDAALACVDHRTLSPLPQNADDDESNVSSARQSFESVPDDHHDSPDGTSSPVSLQPHIRTDSNPPSSVNSSSEFSILANTDSYNDLMTPTRLQRDISRMSLLSSPAKQFHKPLPPRISVDTSSHEPRSGSPGLLSRPVSRLPRLVATPMVRSDRTSELRQIVHFPVQTMLAPGDPAPAVSPMGSDDEFSTSDTDNSVSPISPITPALPDYFSRRPFTQALAITHTEPDHDPTRNYHTAALDRHLTALRTQLQTHMDLLAHAKSRALIAQQPQKPKLASRISGRTLSSRPSPSPTSPNPLSSPQQRSFWSALPEPDKQSEKQRRIQEGRARGWARERFQPEHYRRLADAALMEL